MGKTLSVDLQAEIPGCICIMFMHLVESLESPAELQGKPSDRTPLHL